MKAVEAAAAAAAPSRPSAGWPPTGRTPGDLGGVARRRRRRRAARSTTSASVPRIGPAVSSGDAIAHAPARGADPLGDPVRELRAAAGAEPRAHASRPARCRSCPCRRPAGAPRAGRRRARRPPRRRVESTAATTFSWRVQESSVQFIEPGPDAVAVADDELVVHQVAPAGDRLAPARRASRARAARCAAGPGRTGARRRRRPLVLVVGDAHGDPARGRGADRVGDAVADRAGQPDVVEREVERAARRLEPREQPVGDGLGRLPAVGQRPRLEHGARQYRACASRSPSRTPCSATSAPTRGSRSTPSRPRGPPAPSCSSSPSSASPATRSAPTRARWRCPRATRCWSSWPRPRARSTWSSASSSARRRAVQQRRLPQPRRRAPRAAQDPPADLLALDEGRRFTAGDALQAFPTRFGTAAILICHDAWHPVLAMLAALDGADLLIVPAASGARGDNDELERDWATLLNHHARFTQVHIVFANRVGEENNARFWGGSRVVDPFGDGRRRGPARRRRARRGRPRSRSRRAAPRRDPAAWRTRAWTCSPSEFGRLGRRAPDR